VPEAAFPARLLSSSRSVLSRFLPSTRRLGRQADRNMIEFSRCAFDCLISPGSILCPTLHAYKHRSHSRIASAPASPAISQSSLAASWPTTAWYSLGSSSPTPLQAKLPRRKWKTKWQTVITEVGTVSQDSVKSQESPQNRQSVKTVVKAIITLDCVIHCMYFRALTC
jgi:hypothetical protein